MLFPGGYPGIELLKFLGGIIENREPHVRACVVRMRRGRARARVVGRILVCIAIGAPCVVHTFKLRSKNKT